MLNFKDDIVEIDEIKSLIKNNDDYISEIRNKKDFSHKQTSKVSSNNSKIVKELSEISKKYHESERRINNGLIICFIIICFLRALTLFVPAIYSIIKHTDIPGFSVLGGTITEFISGALIFFITHNLKYRHNSFVINEKYKHYMI